MEENNKKKLVLIWVIVAVILIVFITVLGYLVLKNKGKVSNTLNIENNLDEKIENEQIPVSVEMSDNELTESKNSNKTENDEKVEEKEQTNNKEKNKEENKEENKEKEQTSNKEEKVTEKINKTEQKESKETSTATTTSKKEETSTTNNSNTSNSEKNEKPTLTGTIDENKLIDTSTKYGVEIKKYNYIIYNVYSDGSKEVKSQKSTTEYDRKNYKATTSELLEEAKSARNKNSGMISQVLNNVNAYRKEANTDSKNGVTNRGDLTLDEKLCIAANVRAVEMAYSTKFSHTRPNGSSAMSVLNEMGIKYMAAGENIACGQTTASAVSKSWKNSSGHYENMISGDYSKIGIGVYKLDGAYYWVQLFTN